VVASQTIHPRALNKILSILDVRYFFLHASSTTAGDSVVLINRNLANFCLVVAADP
jgi:hypothetical protein